jgi:hypothetical protein
MSPDLCYAITPGTFEDIVEHLVPELQRRGVHWLDYPEPSNGKHLTAREGIYGVGQTRLPDDHYGSAFKWNVGEENGPELEAGGGVANKAVSTSQTNGTSLKRHVANGDVDTAIAKRVKVVA